MDRVGRLGDEADGGEQFVMSRRGAKKSKRKRDLDASSRKAKRNRRAGNARRHDSGERSSDRSRMTGDVRSGSPNDVVRARSPARIGGTFLALTGAIFFSLLMAWPVVGGAYRSAFIGGANVLLHTHGRDVRVVFSPIPEERGHDVRMEVRNHRAGMMVPRHLGTRYPPYVLTALLIALIVATPLPWRRRLIALALGLIILNAYLYGVLLVTVVRVLSREGPARLHELSSFWDGTLEFVMHHTTHSPTFSTVIPVVIWAAVTFRRGDLMLMLSGDSGRVANKRR
jgi:hypothetical protein